MARNNFAPEVFDIFGQDNWWKCWACGKNHANCGHHIFGRGEKGSTCERSAFNFAPMSNFDCHLPRHGYWRSAKGIEFLIRQTIARLNDVGYVLKDYDIEFLAKYDKKLKKMNITI